MTSADFFLWFRIVLIGVLSIVLMWRIYRNRNNSVDFRKLREMDERLAQRKAVEEELVDRFTRGRTREAGSMEQIRKARERGEPDSATSSAGVSGLRSAASSGLRNSAVDLDDLPDLPDFEDAAAAPAPPPRAPTEPTPTPAPAPQPAVKPSPPPARPPAPQPTMGPGLEDLPDLPDFEDAPTPPMSRAPRAARRPPHAEPSSREVAARAAQTAARAARERAAQQKQKPHPRSGGSNRDVPQRAPAGPDGGRRSLFDPSGIAAEPATGMTVLAFRSEEPAWLTLVIDEGRKRNLVGETEVDVQAALGVVKIQIDDRDRGGSYLLTVQSWSESCLIHLREGQVIACQDTLGPVEWEVEVLKHAVAELPSGVAPSSDEQQTVIIFESEQDAWLNIVIDDEHSLVLMGERLGFLNVSPGTHTLEIEDRVAGGSSRVKLHAWSDRCTVFLSNGYVVSCQDDMGQVPFEWC